jgi:hypothetical protein
MFSIANSVSYKDCVNQGICNLNTFNSEFYYRVIENKTLDNKQCFINEEDNSNTDFILYEEPNKLELSNNQIKKCLDENDIYNLLTIMNIMSCHNIYK